MHSTALYYPSTCLALPPLPPSPLPVPPGRGAVLVLALALRVARLWGLLAVPKCTTTMALDEIQGRP